MSRPGFLLSGVVLMGVLTAVAAEGIVRVLNPTPRVQRVRAEYATSIVERDDTVLWTLREPQIQARGCKNAPEGRFRVAFVGSSIFRGSGVPGDATFTTHLQGASDAWCIDNVSEPAFTAGQKRLVALDLLDEPVAPDILFWEIWTNDPDGYVMLGGDAYNLFHHRVHANGVPDPFGLPASASRWLFEHSAVYAYATLTMGLREDAQRDVRLDWDGLLEANLQPVVDKAKARGTEVVLVLAPRLDRSFAESVVRPPHEYGLVWPFAQAHDLRWIRLAARFEDQDVEALRVDTCCHYSEAGHKALADLFEAEIQDAMAAVRDDSEEAPVSEDAAQDLHEP